jgi:glycosyltransferase involved in cell wall biosynthesis
VRQPSVTLIAGPAGHQKTLPEALAREGLARMVVRVASDLEILEPSSAGGLGPGRRLLGYRMGNRVLWAVRRRVPPTWQRLLPILGWSSLADLWISSNLSPSDIFHGLMSMSLASLDRARSLGAITLVDNPTLHPAAFQREVLADYARFSAPESEHIMPRSAMYRCERQYEICDQIIVYSSVAARSFEPFAHAGKTVVIRPGVDHELFSPPAARDAEVFRACYVGRIAAPKGIHYLIEAWKKLALPNAELVLAGRIFPEMSYLRREAAGMRIRLAGILPPDEVARCYRNSSLFVFPSANEGLSLAVLEAMASGLPAIACRHTGAEDCITPGKHGLLVKTRDAEDLAEAILWCYGHRSEAAAMGRAGRSRIEEEFTLSHYQKRLFGLYRLVTNTN